MTEWNRQPRLPVSSWRAVLLLRFRGYSSMVADPPPSLAFAGCHQVGADEDWGRRMLLSAVCIGIHEVS